MAGRVGIAALGALLAVVLQVVLAPNMAIASVMPSFIISYTLAVAFLLEPVPAYVIAFLLGLVADLLGYGPVGALPFILLICVFAAQHAEATFGNGTFFVSCITLVVFVILAHFLHAAFMVALTSTYTAIEAFQLIAIPQALYDVVLGILLYLLARRLLSPPAGPGLGSGTTSIRLR